MKTIDNLIHSADMDRLSDKSAPSSFNVLYRAASCRTARRRS